jgi:tRNA pseudouridine38-40 synthase
MRIALGIEYDGSAFRGWQRQQTGVRSVQACLEAALSRVADETIEVVCAGRTDAGVHATAQVVHFDTVAVRPERAWLLGTNTELPGDVRVLWRREMAEDFHARYSARARRYRYVILNRRVGSALERHRVGWEYRPLELAPMRAATRHLIGEHDFSSFRAAQCQANHAIRAVESLEVSQSGEYFFVDIVANAFLHHMVRNIVGVLLAIGRGEQAPDWTRELLERRDRTLAAATAPASGLYLVGVRYPEQHGIPELGRLPRFA